MSGLTTEAQTIQHTVEPVKLKSPSLLHFAAWEEEALLHSTLEHIEKELNGELKTPFSVLTEDDIADLEIPETKPPDVDMHPDATQKDIDKKWYIASKFQAQELAKNKELPRVVTEDDLSEPLGPLDSAKLYFSADPHYAPGDTKGSIRENFYKRYGLVASAIRTSQSLKEIALTAIKLPREVVEKFHAWVLTRAPKSLVATFMQSPGKLYEIVKESAMLAAAHPAKALIEKSKDWNTIYKWVVMEDVRNLFNQWKVDTIIRLRKDAGAAAGQKSADILIDLGDNVHDGGRFDDYCYAFAKELELYKYIKDNSFGSDRLLKYLKLYGNHDQDSRVYESFELLNDVFGHQIFEQKVGKVLIVGLDTNIMNPEWIKIFRNMHSQEGLDSLTRVNEACEQRLNELSQLDYEYPKDGTEVQKAQIDSLREEFQYLTSLTEYQQKRIEAMTNDPPRAQKNLDNKLTMQEKLIEHLKDYRDGPILLIGHNPARLVDELGIKNKVLQESNVARIVGGHTHKEAHFVLPISLQNKANKPITLHVVDSYSHLGSDAPPSPKMLEIDIQGDEIGIPISIQENQKSFEGRYKDYIREQREHHPEVLILSADELGSNAPE